jgi:uncharacterized protein YlxW (UPF0749 family)
MEHIIINLFVLEVMTLILVLIESRRITKLKKETDDDRRMLNLLLKDSLKKKVAEMKEHLEDLMNNKKDVKKTRTNRKTK